METITEKEPKTINYFDLPTGKQQFIATVDKFSLEEEMRYNPRSRSYYEVYVQYVYFKEVQILIGNDWHNVVNIEFPLKSKVGKKIDKLGLNEEDIISFFAVVQAKREMLADDNIPKTYNDTVFLEIYETEFTIFNERISKENYCDYVSVEDFKYLKKKNQLNVECEATEKRDGFYRETTPYIWGKQVANLSSIEKF